MPILWRYLFSHYIKVLCLCTLSFVAVLLTTRLEDIAHFATLGAEGYYVFWFSLYQIPYILPIAIPFSCLISAILLIQRLSQTYELTALRSCGFSLKNILAPILIAASFFTVVNFYIISEVATSSHLSAGLLKSELRALNPLLLLNNKQLMRLKGFYFDTFGSSRLGETASDVVLAIPNKSNNRISLLIAKKLEASPTFFKGEGITLISSMETEDRDHYDHLAIENIQQAATTIQDFSQMVERKVWTLNNDHLRLSLLLAKLSDERQNLKQGRLHNLPDSQLKLIQRDINQANSEIMRRLSLALAAFTFTLMGAAFGINISRTNSHKGLYYVIGLATFYLLAFFAAKGISQFVVAFLLYTIPHLIIVLLSIWSLKRATNGIE